MDSWRDRLNRTVGEVRDSVVRKGMKVVADQLPDELKGVAISPESLAHLIVLADQSGLLNDPKARRVKAMAKRIEAGEKPRPEELIELVPDLMRTKVAEQIVPGAGNAEKVAKAAEALVQLHRLGRMTGVIGGGAPEQSPPAPAEAAAPPEGTDTPEPGPAAPPAEPDGKAGPARKPVRRGPDQAAIAEALRQLRDQLGETGGKSSPEGPQVG